MVSSAAKTVDEYIKALPDDRREAITKIREVVLANLPKGYEENMNWGMVCYEIPLTTFPDTYNKQPLMYAAIASQKNYMSLYLTNVYVDPDLTQKFEDDYDKSGKKLDMGKSCIRFKKLEDLPLDVIGKYIAATPPEKYIELFQARYSRGR
jgi:uncharacterized protein YdhG (YjbR/CyaY superfamily)